MSLNNKDKWQEFYSNKLQPDARRLTYELSVLVRYIGKNMPLSHDSIDMLIPRIVEMRTSLDQMQRHLDTLEMKKL